MTKRIYLVDAGGYPNTVRLVRASSPAQAIRHVVKGVYAAAVATQEQIVHFAVDGATAIETAGEEREEP
jgi:hypothetical protein